MIRQFAGEYFFLSNFYRIPEWNGRTVEHYFQAAKAIEITDADAILNAKSPVDAKRLGRNVKIVDGWDSKRISVMISLVAQKFSIPRLRELLLNTGDEHLSEGNWWGDYFWGVKLSTGEGENQLGKILMTVRDIYREGGNVLMWGIEDGKVILRLILTDDW